MSLFDSIQEKFKTIPVELDYLKSLGIKIVVGESTIFFKDPVYAILRISKHETTTQYHYNDVIKVILSNPLHIRGCMFIKYTHDSRLFKVPPNFNQPLIREKDIPRLTKEIFKILNIQIHETVHREGDLYVTSLRVNSS